MAEIVEASVDDFHVGLLRLNHPETRNSLSAEMREGILAGLERFDEDPEVRCVVIAGSDKIFASGADIRALAARALGEPADAKGIEFWRRIAAVQTPIVAAVAGYALGGGCELALACDMIVAEETVRFGQPEITLGIIPGGGGTQRLTRAIGKQRAMEYVLTGRHFDAGLAAAWGIVNKVAKTGQSTLEAVELARTIAERPPIAIRLAKRAVLIAQESRMSDGLTAERGLFDEAMATEDRVEGMQAFLEKREPNFRGR
ncbi:MAG TPA: enoyl-CoA hydratase-related protein [Solirubrobacterales bacterium]|jgi:enoyl-CoA hydratase|nr:enoyl-CoA hydratase-related protein [Solirubrobacterales bacterium]